MNSQTPDGSSPGQDAGGPSRQEHRSQFVSAMRLVPGAVAVVAAAHAGDRTGMAATAWTSLSADPPKLLACINRNASLFPMVLRAGAFSINMLSPDQSEIVEIFSAKRGLEGAARFSPTEWSTGHFGQPLLQTAVASFECELSDTHHHESHVIFIGRVKGILRPEPPRPALLYVDGRYASAVPVQS